LLLTFPSLPALAADALYSPDSQAAATGAHACYTRFAGTLDGLPCGGGGGDSSGGGVAAFDAVAFRIPAAEAALLDPHTRQLLHHAAAALADARGRAAAAPGRLPEIGGSSSVPASGASGGGSTGVFVGCMWAAGKCLPAPRCLSLQLDLLHVLFGGVCCWPEPATSPLLPKPGFRSQNPSYETRCIDASPAAEFVELLPARGASNTAAAATTGALAALSTRFAVCGSCTARTSRPASSPQP
jgi:hypothetical protein